MVLKTPLGCHKGKCIQGQMTPLTFDATATHAEAAGVGFQRGLTRELVSGEVPGRGREGTRLHESCGEQSFLPKGRQQQPWLCLRGPGRSDSYRELKQAYFALTWMGQVSLSSSDLRNYAGSALVSPWMGDHQGKTRLLILRSRGGSYVLWEDEIQYCDKG